LINSTSLLAQYQTKRPKSERDRRNQDRYAREIAIAEGLAEGRAVGLEEGLAEGRAEGRAEGINSVIKQMHTKGMSIQQIADIVEMPVDEIQAIVQL
jgi:predicted transposase/invertase (TIGR01784 family)